MVAPRTSTRTVLEFLETIEERLAPLDRSLLEFEWRLATGRGAAGSGAVRANRHRLLASPGLIERIRRYRDRPLPRSAARRLEILERTVLESQIEQDPEIARRRDHLSRKISDFRPLWHGRRVGRVVVWNAFRLARDRRERERAYYAEDPLYRPMERAVHALAEARNDRARTFGFRSFAEFRLSLEGLSVARFESLIDEAVRYVPAEMRRRREEFHERSGTTGWYPWDPSFAEQQVSGLPDRAFPGPVMIRTVIAGIRRWGFPPSAFRFRVDRHDIAAGGLCLAPDPPQDVRVIVHPGGGWHQYMVLFHEIGHALASRSIRQPTHLLRWHEHVPGFAGLAEGEGRFFEQIAGRGAWLRERPGLTDEEVTARVDGARRAPLATMGFLTRWVTQELALYRDPSKDPGEVGYRFARRVFGFDAYRSISFADSFLVELPLYSPSYLYAELLRPLLTDAVLAEVGGALWPNPRVGPWLVDRWFRDGSSFDWWTRVREVTGRPFGARAFNAEMREVVR